MDAIVTGGSGFIGSHVVEKLCGAGHTVLNIDVQHPEYESDAEYFYWDIRDSMPERSDRYDVIFHCAGLLGTETLFNRVRNAVEVNVIGTVNILDYALACDCAVVQPNLMGEWSNPYMITKHCAEDIGLMYHSQLGVKYISVRPTDVYGPRQSADELKAAPVFILNAIHNTPIPIYGDGSSWVNYVYVADVADCLIAAANARLYGSIIDFARPAGDMKVSEFAEAVCKVANSSSRFEYQKMRRGQPGNTTKIDYNLFLTGQIMDMSKLMPLEEGLRRTIDWYRVHA